MPVVPGAKRTIGREPPRRNPGHAEGWRGSPRGQTVVPIHVRHRRCGRKSGGFPFSL